MVRTRNVEKAADQAEGGVGLFMSGGPVSREILGSTEWREVVYPFRVPEGGAEVELVCQLRATQGECWFDKTSLRLVKGQ
jgi:hypothetical protein